MTQHLPLFNVLVTGSTAAQVGERHARRKSLAVSLVACLKAQGHTVTWGPPDRLLERDLYVVGLVEPAYPYAHHAPAALIQLAVAEAAMMPVRVLLDDDRPEDEVVEALTAGLQRAYDDFNAWVAWHNALHPRYPVAREDYGTLYRAVQRLVFKPWPQVVLPGTKYHRVLGYDDVDGSPLLEEVLRAPGKARGGGDAPVQG